MKSLFEQLGGTYTRQGDYCLPNVCLPPEEERPIGVYGHAAAEKKNDEREYITYASPETVRQYFLFLTN